MAEKDFEKIRKITEAALFLAGKSLTIEEVSKYSNAPIPKVQKALEEIKGDYLKSNSPIELTEVEGGKFKLNVKLEYLDIVKNLAPQMDMRKAVLTTLSYIAFKQPIMQSKMVRMFGNRIYEYNSELEKRGLINRVPHKRTRMLTTTKKLENYLGTADLEGIKRTKVDHLEQQLKAEIAKEEAAEKKKLTDEVQQLERKKELSIEEWEKLLEHRRVAEQKRTEKREKRKKAREGQNAANQSQGTGSA